MVQLPCGVAQRVRDIECINARNTDDIARLCRFHLDSLESVIAHHLEYLAVAGARVAIDDGHLCVWTTACHG